MVILEGCREDSNKHKGYFQFIEFSYQYITITYYTFILKFGITPDIKNIRARKTFKVPIEYLTHTDSRHSEYSGKSAKQHITIMAKFHSLRKSQAKKFMAVRIVYNFQQ